jgi:predicted protein tyrosine phosphatase
VLPLSRCKLLFICARNKIRSLTAERMLHGSTLYDVRSRGLARGARVRLTAGDIGWADRIFVMEKQHKDRLRAEFAEALRGKPVECLFIADVYQPMEPALLALLRERLAPHIDLPGP